MRSTYLCGNVHPGSGGVAWPAHSAAVSLQDGLRNAFACCAVLSAAPLAWRRNSDRGDGPASSLESGVLEATLGDEIICHVKVSATLRGYRSAINHVAFGAS